MSAPLLAADIGNSHTVVGLVADGAVLRDWRVATDDRRTADEWAVWGHMSFLFDDLSAGANDVWDYISALNTTGKIAVKTEAQKTSHESRENFIPKWKRQRLF